MDIASHTLPILPDLLGSVHIGGAVEIRTLRAEQGDDADKLYEGFVG